MHIKALFLGETSSGKSTLINVLLGEEILPINVTASTTKVCRLRHSETWSLTTRESNGHELTTTTFDSRSERKQMIRSIQTEVTSSSNDTMYVDINMSLPELPEVRKVL